VRVRGTLHWDILSLYREVLAGLQAAASERIDSVGVDSWAVDFGLVDRQGRLIGNPVHYRDTRRAAGLELVLAKVPARELYARTGIQILPINTLCELVGMVAEGDASLESADTLLMIPDLLHYWLAGTRVGERTNASTTQCLDAVTGRWSGDLLELLSVPAALLPELVEAGTPLGRLAADVAAETGLDAPLVVAVGTHDTASAVAAIPFRTAGSAYISAGTWSLAGVEIGAPLITDAGFAANLTNEGGVAGTIRLLRNITGLWLLEECRRAWSEGGSDYSFAQ